MSRFDLYRGKGYADYLLDVQSDHLSFLESRLVVPVLNAEKMSLINPRLHVQLTINEKTFYTVTNMMGAVSLHALGNPIGNVRNQDYEIISAIDFLLQGF